MERIDLTYLMFDKRYDKILVDTTLIDWIGRYESNNILRRAKIKIYYYYYIHYSSIFSYLFIYLLFILNHYHIIRHSHADVTRPY